MCQITITRLPIFVTTMVYTCRLVILSHSGPHKAKETLTNIAKLTKV